MTLTSPAGPFLDPRISLATALHSQPGVYALLLGSGVSTGPGVPTGWGVVQALVAEAAAASGEDVPTDLDPENWWLEHGDGSPLGYSSLLASLAGTPAARRALLAGFFEPSDENREQGVKIPSAAHRAIAALVRRGAVRVIVTTNFDRLIEQALEADGIFPQVVATATAIQGMEPLAHARCTVIKLHGDYARIDQLNTIEELSQYPDELQTLLDRVLDEYGLIISGWSGEWDSALVSAIEGVRSRRYPLFWVTRGALRETAKRLVAEHRACVIENADADQFFPDLISRLEALDSLADPPLSQAIAIARLKRLLPDPFKYIEVRDLFSAEVGRVRAYLPTRGQLTPTTDPQGLQDAHDVIRAKCDTLLHLMATGVYLDRDRQHTDLWVWVIEQLMRARPHIDGAFNDFWVNLNHYPAALALKTGSLAAVAARHDDVLLRLQREPTWRSQYDNRQSVAALEALRDWQVLDHGAINSFPRWGGTRWNYPRSHLLKEELRPVILPLVGDEASYIQLFNRTEYRIAVAQALSSEPGRRSATEGEFIGEWQWGNNDTLVWETDFRENADRSAWGWEQTADHEANPFSTALDELSAELRKGRRWG